VPGIWTETQTQAWQRVNRRIDRYGGSAENRCRFLFEVVAALVAQVEAGRLGVRCRWRLRPQDFAPHSFQLKRGRCGGGTGPRRLRPKLVPPGLSIVPGFGLKTDAYRRHVLRLQCSRTNISTPQRWVLLI
jgi:hypothetical protein